MADQAGPQPLLEVVPKLGVAAAAGDALLDILGSYLRATLNARASVVWSAIAPDSNVMDGAAVVRDLFAFDPEPAGHEFLDRALPSLFLWRESFEPASWLAQGWRVRQSTIRFAWVFPMAPMARQSPRAPFHNALVSVIDEVLEFKGRDPSWTYPDDPDPRAPTEGSNLWTFADVFRLTLGKTTQSPMSIRGPAGTSGAPPKTYWRITGILDVLERVDQDPAAWFDAENGLDMATSLAPDDPAGALAFLDPLLYRGPSVVSVTPATGTHLGGTAVTIASDEDTFRDGATVDIGGVSASSVVVVDTKTITAVTPAVGAGAADVTVTNPDGSNDTLADGFTFT